MRNFNRLAMMAILVCLFGIKLSAQTESKSTQSETLLPASTKAAVIVGNLSELSNRIQESSSNEIYRNPEVIAYLDSVRDYLDKELDSRGVQIKIDPTEILSTFQQEVSVAILDEGGDLGFCFLAEAGDRPDAIKEFIRSSQDKIVSRGGERKAGQSIGDLKLSAVKLPPIPAIAREPDTMFSVVHKGWLISSNKKTVIKKVADNLALSVAKRKDCLSKSDGYIQTMKQLDTSSSSVKWFADPIGMGLALQHRVPRNDKFFDYIAKFKKHGFDAVKGISGMAEVGDGKRELVFKNFVYSPGAGEQLEKEMRIFDFSNSEKLKMDPGKWVPRNVASWASITWNLESAYEAGLPLADTFVLGKPNGALKKGIDLFEKEAGFSIKGNIIDQLGKKFTFATASKLPVSLSSEKMMLVTKVTGDSAKIEVAIDRIIRAVRALAPDDELFDGEIVKKIKHEGVEITVIDMVKLNEGGGSEVDPLIGDPILPEDDLIQLPDEEEGEAEEKEVRADLVQKLAICFVDGHLLITNDEEFSKEIVDGARAEKPMSLADATDYQSVKKELDQITEGATSFRRFARMANVMRASYTLYRERRLPESESILGSLLNAFLPKDESGKFKRSTVDPELLPADFDSVIAPHLGTLGWSTKTVKDGWMISGVLLRPSDQQMVDSDKNDKEHSTAEKSGETEKK